MARLNESSYDIATPTGVCAATGAVIEPGDRYVAVLFEVPGDERLQRLDFGTDAWEGGSAQLELAPPRRVFGSWRAVMPAPDAARRRLIDDDGLVDLFEQSAESTGERAGAAFRYVLALILVRKRLLKMEGTRGRTILVRWPKQEAQAPPIEVDDPGMDEATVAEVIGQLGVVIPDAPE